MFLLRQQSTLYQKQPTIGVNVGYFWVGVYMR